MNATSLHYPAPACEAAESDFTSNLLAALGHIYLEAGLPLAAAFEAALADFESFRTDSNLCRT
jgi:hypothetical protein